MASAKDTFEAKTFAANSFACGTWRGVGVAVDQPSVPGLQWTATDGRLHYASEDYRLHYTSNDWRMHYKGQ